MASFNGEIQWRDRIMTEAFKLPPDRLSELAPSDVQRMAARMAQDAFGRIFRLTLTGPETEIHMASDEIEHRIRTWAKAGGNGRAVRLAMLVSGMDQWGLAYCQAFDLQSIPGLGALLGALRGGLDPVDDAQFQQQFAALNAAEADGIDFKMELRRHIHLALWHAMIACDEADGRPEAQRILGKLGGMMWVLTQQMPTLGWRLVADALAHIQIRCLSDAAASAGMAQENTQALFDALRQSLGKEQFDLIIAHANEAAISWQQAQRRPN